MILRSKYIYIGFAQQVSGVKKLKRSSASKPF